MILLGIETSCDETAAAIVSVDEKTKQCTVLSSVIASSLLLHSQTGGIIPEIAAREQIKFIIPVINQALKEAHISDNNPEIDAIAVTYGPGLIGSLLVGVETAKTLSLLWNKPLIPVNHLYGHIYANWIQNTKNKRETTIKLPALALVVSGGHTDLVMIKNHSTLEVIGGTRDDAAGEAFDKIGRLLGLSYPAGPTISKLAKKGNPNRFILPRPMIGSLDFDFSFSGLKTSVLNLMKTNNWSFDTGSEENNQQLLFDICASVEWAIVDVLVKKTMKAVKEKNVTTLLLGGGVAANDKLQETFKEQSSKYTINFSSPEKKFCTDNAAMIATAAYFHHTKTTWQNITADPELYY